MTKEWYDIDEFNGKYQITKDGNIRSIEYIREDKNGNAFTRKGTLLKNTISKQGYVTVCFHFNNKSNTRFVHKLLAQTFIPNSENKPCVHHIDHNKQNNSLGNLMWVTYSENIKFNYTTGGQIGKTNMKGKFGKLNTTSKGVKQISLTGELIKVHESLQMAAREVGGDFSHISKVCRGILNKHKKYKWQFA
jgi:hypothetical protein